MSDYADLVVHHMHKRRTEFATAAALFSILLHIALIVGLALSPLDLPFWKPLFDTAPPREPPMQVQEVVREAAPPIVRNAEPGRAGAAQGPSTLDKQSVERLETPLDRVEIEPPPPAAGHEVAPSAALQDLNLPPEAESWQPRHTIMEVEHAAVRDELAARERRRIPRLERVIDAPDVVYPAKPAAATVAATAPGADAAIAKPSLATILRRVTSGAPSHAEAAPIADAVTRSGHVLTETAGDVTDMQAIEGLLSARITTYTSRREPDVAYFRVEISRRSDEALPVLPKDVLFIQDCSASMSEQRLYFCRQGLIDSLPSIGPEDRFNIVAFRDQVESCFEGWMTNSVAARARAEQFVQGLQSHGETDLFTGIRAALNFTMQPGRPVIVILVSDGYATTGITGGAAIIREFTQANRGAISVFSLGTTPQAYRYLLDLLSYSNRGDSRLVASGRWDIPKEIARMSEEVRNPVLAEVGLGVAAATPAEVYPVQTMNLYRDRPLVLYGRYPRSLDHVVMQATGQAAATRCDMVFDLNLKNAPVEEHEDLREAWARQKIYHLLGEQARTRNPALLLELDETARTYHVPVPYRDDL